MTVITFSEFRKNLAHFLNLVQDNCEEVIISRGKGRKAIIVSLEEYESLQETAYLMSTPANRKHLEKSKKELEEGKVRKVSFA